MGHQFSRSALYDLVWSEPRTMLAKRLGVSDVGFAKACACAQIPMPPRGYWARVAAGKCTPRTALPVRGLGQSDMVDIGRQAYRSHAAQEEQFPGPAPVFDEPLETVRARATRMVTKAKVPQNLQRPHGLIAALLEEDAARERASERNSNAYPKPEFDTPQALRRLRIINALFVVLGHAGCKGSIGSKDVRHVSFRVGDIILRIKVDSYKPASRQASSRTIPSNGWIRLVAEGWPPVDGIPTEWQDETNAPLERQIRDIARDILVLGEWHYRAAVIQHHARQVQRHNERERQARELRERMMREAHERMMREAHERRDWLQRQASNLQEARAIRALVWALDERDPTGSSESEVTAYQHWRAWALAEADRLDPRMQPLSAVIAPRTSDAS